MTPGASKTAEALNRFQRMIGRPSDEENARLVAKLRAGVEPPPGWNRMRRWDGRRMVPAPPDLPAWPHPSLPGPQAA